MTLGAIDPTPGPDGKVKKAKLFLKNSKITKNRTKTKSRKVLLHDKLSWFEHGRQGQKARPIYSDAVKGFLKEMGFIPDGGVEAATKAGTHKTTVKKGSKAEEEVQKLARERLLKSTFRDYQRSKSKK
jgi:hypothetical protein